MKATAIQPTPKALHVWPAVETGVRVSLVDQAGRFVELNELIVEAD